MLLWIRQHQFFWLSPALPASEDFLQLLDTREGRPFLGFRHLDGPDQNAGFLSLPSVDVNDVAVHGSLGEPLIAADGFLYLLDETLGDLSSRIATEKPGTAHQAPEPSGLSEPKTRLSTIRVSRNGLCGSLVLVWKKASWRTVPLPSDRRPRPPYPFPPGSPIPLKWRYLRGPAGPLRGGAEGATIGYLERVVAAWRGSNTAP